MHVAHELGGNCLQLGYILLGEGRTQSACKTVDASGEIGDVGLWHAEDGAYDACRHPAGEIRDEVHFATIVVLGDESVRDRTDAGPELSNELEGEGLCQGRASAPVIRAI